MTAELAGQSDQFDLAQFDLAQYVRDPIDVRPRDLDLTAMGGLAPPLLAALNQLWSIERGVLDLLRDLLLTPTHAEGRVTAFLNTWAYEQYWLAQSLAAVLEANGVTPQESPDTVLGSLRRFADERLSPTLVAIRTNLIGEQLVASHMAIGWLTTAVMQLGYARLAELDDRLTTLATAVVPLKARHLQFYAEESRNRLKSRSAQRLTRRALARWRWPGVKYCGTRAVRPGVTTLYGDSSTRQRIRAIDTDLNRFPGLAQARPVQKALALI